MLIDTLTFSVFILQWQRCPIHNVQINPVNYESDNLGISSENRLQYVSKTSLNIEEKTQQSAIPQVKEKLQLIWIFIQQKHEKKPSISHLYL